MDLPLITIGITCFNSEDTIIRAVNSALAQDWPNMEVVVVDDCSQDRSLLRLKESVESDGRITLIVHEVNRGCAAARNSVVRSAKGRFIAFFDDDDESRADRLSKQHDRITEYEKTAGSRLVACYSSGVRIYPNGYSMPFRAIGSESLVPIGCSVADRLLFFGKKRGVFYGRGTPTCSLMARKETFESVGPFDTNLRRQEDIDFAIRLALLGGHFVGTRAPVLTQYASTGPDKSADLENRSYRQIIEKNREYLIERNRYWYALGWSEIRYRHFKGQKFRAFRALMMLASRHPLKVASHFLKSAPRRLLHEVRMSAGNKPAGK